jgi:hypothetical protein
MWKREKREERVKPALALYLGYTRETRKKDVACNLDPIACML